MTEPQNPDELSPADLMQIESLCDEYDDALKAGKRPRQVNYLSRVPESARPRLQAGLDQLLDEHSQQKGENSTPSASGLPSTVPYESPADVRATELPESVGRYKILAYLGEGAMGIVYRAHHPVLRQEVALKTILPQRFLSSAETTRILEEARNVAKLNHPNVVAIHDADEENGLPFFTMVLVKGGTLLARIDEFRFGTPLKNEKGHTVGLTTAGWTRKRLWERRQKILALVEDICGAVHAAHTNKPTIIHRDLKPGNVLLEGDKPKVSDFGLARTVATDDDEQIPADGYAGTPPYMSPEQHRGKTKNILAPSDVWAIGVILFELFTGRRPFLVEGREKLKPWERRERFKHAVLNTEPPRPRELNQRIEPALQFIILKCLEKDVAQRYPSAAIVADRLVRCGNLEPDPDQPISWLERLWLWARRKPAIAGLCGLAGVTLIAGAVLFIAFTLHKSRLSREEQTKAATDALDRGIALCEQGEAAEGMLHLARSLEMAPADALDLRRLIQGNLSGWHSHISPLQAMLDERSRVLAVAFSPDGRTFVTGNAEGIVQVRDTATGQPVGEPIPHPAQVLAVAFSPVDRAILTGCFDGNARLWNAAATERVPQLLPHPGIVFAVGFSPDGKTLFSAGEHGTVKLWEALSGKPLGELPRDEDLILSLAISSDGKALATGTVNKNRTVGRARLWNVATREPIGEPFTHQGAVWAVTFSPQDKTILTGGDQEALHWELDKPDRPRPVRFPHGVPVRSVAFSRDGKTILTGSNDKTARLWDAASGRPLGAPLQHADKVRSVAFSPDRDSSLILTGSEDSSARLWQTAALTRQGARLSRERPVTAAALSHDGKTALTGSRDRTAQLWDVATRTPVGPLFWHDRGVRDVAFSPDGKTVLTLGDENTVRLWDMRTGAALPTSLRHDGRVATVAFSPHGERIVTGCADHKARAWDVQTGRLVAELPHEGRISTAVFSSDGAMILTSSNDGNAKLWRVASGKLITTFSGHEKAVLAAAISRDIKTVLTGSSDGTARLWDASTGFPSCPPLQHEGPVHAVAFSRDGLTALTGSDDGTARLWKAPSGTALGARLRHQGAVRSAAFGPDDRLVLTGSHDRSARLWDVATSRPFGPPFQHNEPVWIVSMSPDGRVMLAACEDVAWLWKLPAPLEGPTKGSVLWSQVLTGMELDETWAAHPLNAEEWQQRRQHLEGN